MGASIDIKGQTISLDRGDLSIGEMCDLEDSFGGYYDEWAKAFAGGSVKAIRALLLVCGRRTNPGLALDDLNAADLSTLRRTPGTQGAPPDDNGETVPDEEPESPTPAA